MPHWMVPCTGYVFDHVLAPGVGVMRWERFSARAPWGTCAVLAGATSLGSALTGTGAAAWVARALFGRLAGTDSAPAMALTVFLVTALITLAIPNRAAAITLGVPLAAAYAHAGPLSGAAAGLVVMIAVDAETIYPAQTAANQQEPRIASRERTANPRDMAAERVEIDPNRVKTDRF